MKIDLLNAEAFGNMAFDQMHNTYVMLREERGKTLAKVRTEAFKQLKEKLMEEIHWWQVSDADGVTYGYGYGTARGVCALFVNKDYKDCYDELWVKLIPTNKSLPAAFVRHTECKYKLAVNLSFDFNIPEFKQLEEELARKGLTLPKIN